MLLHWSFTLLVLPVMSFHFFKIYIRCLDIFSGFLLVLITPLLRVGIIYGIWLSFFKRKQCQVCFRITHHGVYELASAILWIQQNRVKCYSLLCFLPHPLSFKVLFRPGFLTFLWLFSTEEIAGSVSKVPWQTQNPEFKYYYPSLLIFLRWKETYHFLQVLAGSQR